MNSLDSYYLEVAAHYAKASEDPSTKTGCVLAGAHGLIAGGCNAFPQGVEATHERLHDRSLKYPMVVHAEMNAMIAASFRAAGATAYLHPWPPCADCAGVMIQCGIERVVAPEPTAEQISRWSASFDIMQTMFNEAGVVLDLVPAT